ncbi:MAG: CapA family protein [Spartobacteria bacterium]|nr:CapA family protein [Spartobacteria bacterium]
MSEQLCFVGDIGLHFSPGDVGSICDELHERLNAQSLIVGNIEGVLAEGGAPLPHKYACLRAVPHGLDLITGLSVAVLANNHIGDFGPCAALDTQQQLEGRGIKTVGLGQNLATASEPLTFVLGHDTVGLISCSCLTTNGDNIATVDSPGVMPLTLPMIRQRLSELREKVSVIIVYLHWGLEHTHEVALDQVWLAHELIDCGADAVIGSHGHSIQPFEVYNGKHIFYGLGNYYFPDVEWSWIKEDGEVTRGVYRNKALNRESLVPVFSIREDRLVVDDVLCARFDMERIPHFVGRHELSVDLDMLNDQFRKRCRWLNAKKMTSADICYEARWVGSRYGYFYKTKPLSCYSYTEKLLYNILGY